jgi:hypothetical protein
MVRRLALWWWTCRDAGRPSARAWAKQLRVSHVWVLKLVRKFETDPGEVRRLQAYGDPTPEQLNRAREYTQRMRDRGQLRSQRRRVTPSIEPAMEHFVRKRFAQGWSKSRLARELFLDRRTVTSILQKVTQNSGQEPQRDCRRNGGKTAAVPQIHISDNPVSDQLSVLSASCFAPLQSQCSDRWEDR